MPTNIFDMQDTWNAGGTTFYAIRMNVNPAAFAVGSRLLDLAVNNVSRFAVDPTNGVLVGNVTGGMKGPGTVNASAYYINGNLFDPTVLQPLDADLSAIAALTGVNTIYYRSAPNIWSPVLMGAGMAFAGGTLSVTGTGFAPSTSEFITSVPDASLSSERVLTDSVTVAWDRTVAGQIKANTIAGGGNVSAVPTPAALQYARWVTATTIEGRTPAQVLTDIGAAPAGSFVAKTGDTMTGDLFINKVQPLLTLDRLPGGGAFITGKLNGSTRWQIALGDATAEGGSNIGSNFSIARNSDTGVLLDFPLVIGRQNGTMAVNAVITSGDVTISKIQPLLILDKAASGQTAGIQAKMAGLPRWQMNLGGVGAETGSDAGSDFELVSSHDNGTQIGVPLTISRATGQATLNVTPSPATDSSFKAATTQFVQQAIAVALAGASAFSTGDAKLTLKNVADPTWILMNDGTIGSATSGSSTRANADCQALFTLIFNNVTDAFAPILTSAGAGTTRAAQTNAATAWANNCRMTLTRQLGRSICVGGTGAGLTGRVTGGFLGAETHTQTLAEMFSHNHTVNDPNHFHTATGATFFAMTNASGAVDFGLGGGFGMYPVNMYGSLNVAATGVSTAAAGSTAAMDIMNPSSYWNVMIKL